MPEPIAYLNGQWLPQSQAMLPLHDAGFVMGVTITELVRTFHHQLFRWPEHLTRFTESRKAAWFVDFHVPDETITAVAEEIIRRNAALVPKTQELALVMFATPGPIGYYMGEPGGLGDRPATFGMHTFPLPSSRYRGLIQHGAHLRVCDIVQAMPPFTVPPQIKHRSRLHWHIADQEVWSKDLGTSRALLLNEKGHVTETAIANFLIVEGDTVVSPRRETILPGISLQTIEELCSEVSLKFVERHLTLDECLAADEALVCGTAFCLARVSRLNDHSYSPNSPVHDKLHDAWSHRVGLKIHEQILNG